MKRFQVLGVSLAMIAAMACAGGGADVTQKERPEVKRATAYLNPRSGSEASGSAIFIKTGDQVELQVSVKGVEPGVHACHIHDVGDCSADDASSAGGHWNPSESLHGEWGSAAHHLGDLGNITVAEDGTGTLTLITDMWSMGTGEKNDILDHSVILHAAADDFETQPTGRAAGRIACGVIGTGAGR